MIPGFIPPSDRNQEADRAGHGNHLDDREVEIRPTSPADLPAAVGELLAQSGIIGTQGMTGKEIIHELRRGGKFVIFQYCVSVVFVTVLQNSVLHFLKAGQPASHYGSKYSGMSMLLGWWGFPWGPIRTIQALSNNANGIDVTAAIMDRLGTNRHHSEEEMAPRRKRTKNGRARISREQRGGNDYGIDE